MPVAKLTCPKCRAVLKPAKPVPAGKKVRCPKCSTTFAVPDDEEETVQVKPATAQKSAGAPKKKAFEDEADEGGTYAVVREPEPEQEQEEEEEDEEDDEEEEGAKKKRSKKPDLTFADDLSVKDPRGPAQAAVIRPSNWLLLNGALGCLLGLISVGYGAFPFLFSEHLGVKPQGVLKDAKGASVTKEWKDLTKDELATIENAEANKLLELIGYIAGGIIGMIYNGVIVLGAVKMQNLESYGWSMASAIMTIIPISGALPLLSSLIGVAGLMTLRDPKVMAGFYYKGDTTSPAVRRHRD